MTDYTNTAHDGGDTPATPKTTTITENRLHLCLEAAWELDALARCLPGLVLNVEDTKMSYLAVRGIAGRLLRLASVLMSGLDDDSESEAKLQSILFLEGQG